MTDNPGLRPYAFVLAVPDLAKTASYFENVLGFRTEWGDMTNWQTLSRGNVRVKIGHCPNAMPPADTGDHSYFAYLHTDDVDALHREVAERGATVLAAPADKSWGMREMLLATPDGHRMMVGQAHGNSRSSPK